MVTENLLAQDAVIEEERLFMATVFWEYYLFLCDIFKDSHRHT